MNSYTNNTTDHHVVGNCETLISSHGSKQAAEASITTPICDTEWACRYIVGPGETVTAKSEFVKSEYKPEAGYSIFDHLGITSEAE